MSRILPSPLLSATLLATWLLLNNSLAAGQILLGLLLAVAVPLVTGGRSSVPSPRLRGEGQGEGYGPAGDSTFPLTPALSPGPGGEGEARTLTENSAAGERRFARGVVAGRLVLRVLGDIVVSNIDVARRILGPESLLQPRFVWVPLDIRDARGIAALMAVVTLTPGTVSADLSPDRRRLLVHGLHVPDEAELVATVKQRYEAPLKEIFP